MTCAPSDWTIDATATLAVITDSASERPDSRPTTGSPTLHPPPWAAPGAPASPEPKPLRQQYAEAAAVAATHAAVGLSTPLSPGLVSDREFDSLDLGGQDSYFTLGGTSSVLSLGMATGRLAAAAALEDGDAGAAAPGSLRARFGGAAAGRAMTPLELPVDPGGDASDDDGTHVRCGWDCCVLASPFHALMRADARYAHVLSSCFMLHCCTMCSCLVGCTGLVVPGQVAWFVWETVIHVNRNCLPSSCVACAEPLAARCVDLREPTMLGTSRSTCDVHFRTVRPVGISC